MMKYYKQGLFDRYDGWRVRKIADVNAIIPFVMRSRVDSQCFFEETADADKLEAFIREHKEDLPGLSVMHIVIAAMVRAISQRPYINRFVVWNKIYAHNSITIAMMVKRGMGDAAEETPIQPEFSPADTLYDVVEKVNAEVQKTKLTEERNSADNTAKLLGKLPAWALRIVVTALYGLDAVGLLPKGVHAASPWHNSAFITNVGSLGIGPIYHHLYKFGTCSFFVAMGKKFKRNDIADDGTVVRRKLIGLRCVVDERVCDGHYYALSMRYIQKLLNHPEVLLAPPKQIVVDDCLNKKLLLDPQTLIEQKKQELAEKGLLTAPAE